MTQDLISTGKSDTVIVTIIAPAGKNLLGTDLVNEIARQAHSTITQTNGSANVRWLAEGEAAELEISAARISEFTNAISAFLADKPIDYAIQPSTNRKRAVLIADMDSTMIDQECIDELAAEVGVKDRVATITAKAMNGEIEFESALRERVALLKGLDESVADTVIKNRITLAVGGKTLLATMKHNGAHTALVSGGFTLFTSRIAAMLGFDENHANILETQNGKLTGTVKEPILGAAAKVDALNTIASQRGLTPSDFIAVGDGANDLPMLTLAGTGVALHAKPNVAAQASICINHGDLTALLYLQGYSKDQFVQA